MAWIDAPLSLQTEGSFAGREDFLARVRVSLVQAAEQQWSELVLCDPDFEDWPLGERGVVDALNAWAVHGQRLRVLATGFQLLQRRHDRFMNFRRQWSHKIECRTVGRDDPPSLLLGPRWLLQRLDRERCTGLGSFDAGRVLRARERFEERWGTGRAGLHGSVLGL